MSQDFRGVASAHGRTGEGIDVDVMGLQKRASVFLLTPGCPGLIFFPVCGVMLSLHFPVIRVRKVRVLVLQDPPTIGEVHGEGSWLPFHALYDEVLIAMSPPGTEAGERECKESTQALNGCSRGNA